MDRVKELQATICKARAEIDEIHRQEVRKAHEEGLTRYPKFNAMTPAQQQHCCFMGFDPDNPDVPLD